MTIKKWKDEGKTITSRELKGKSITIQRLARIFDSIEFLQNEKIWVVRMETNEHPELDKYRIIVSNHLEPIIIRRFHEIPQEGHFATNKTADKILNHSWISTPITSVTKQIAKCLPCQLKKNSIIHKIKKQRSAMFNEKEVTR